MKNNWIIGLILAIILAIVAIIFALQNSEQTAISFLSWDLILPLALIIISTFVIGAITALLLTIPGTFKRKVLISNLKKENNRILELLNKVKLKTTTETNNDIEQSTES